MPFFIFILCLIEIIIFVQVGYLIGFVWAIVLIFATGFIGTKFVRFEGQQNMNKILSELQSGGSLGMEIPDSLVLLFAGFLLVLPGFLTDFFGLLLLIPPLRQLLMVSLIRKMLEDVLVTLGKPEETANSYSAIRKTTVYKDSRGSNIIEGEFERKEED